MTPRYVFWECRNCDEEFKREHCFKDGAYCATSKTRLTGQQILLEDLRQMCIYNQAYNQDDNRKLFWDYIVQAHDECGSMLDEDCSKYAH